MTDVRPLAVWPYPLTDGRLEALRLAKAELDLPYLITPVPAAPGGPGRVLCFGEIPPHACEAVLIAPMNTEDQSRVRVALEALLRGATSGPGIISHEMWLSAVMGSDVTFLYEMVHDDEFADPFALDISHDVLRAGAFARKEAA